MLLNLIFLLLFLIVLIEELLRRGVIKIPGVQYPPEPAPPSPFKQRIRRLLHQLTYEDTRIVARPRDDVDIKIYKGGAGTLLGVVKCLEIAPDATISPEAIRAIHRLRQAYRARDAYLASTGRADETATRLANDLEVWLMDSAELERLYKLGFGWEWTTPSQ